MSARDTVKAAALLAARHALPDMPEVLVRWNDEEACQSDDNWPDIELSTVSMVEEHAGGRTCLTTRDDGLLRRDLSQLYRWNVQIQVEGYSVDRQSLLNPWDFTLRMRQGWLTKACLDALKSDDDTRVSMLSTPSTVRPLTRGVKGHTLPIYIYEIPFRFVAFSTDETPEYVIETVSIAGVVRQGSTPHPNDVDDIQIDVPPT